jgi:hypothetical protein
LAKLDGDTLLERAKNDVLIQEYDDIVGFVGKAHYAENRKEAMDALYGTKLPGIYKQLEALMDGTVFYFTCVVVHFLNQKFVGKG